MPPAADADRGGPATEAARVGAELRAARLRLGLALPDVAAKLRIRLSFLEAVEDGRLDDLPGPVYAVGFARAYAVLLGLDAAAVARRFRLEADEAAQKTELDFPAPAPEGGVPAGAVVLLGTLLAAAAYAGWYRFSDDARPAATVQALPERLAPLASRAAAPDPPPAAAPAEPPVPAMPVPSPPPSLNEPVVPPLAVAALPPPTLPSSDKSRVLLRTNADAWVQVRERQGHVLLNRVMRGGESWAVPKGPPLLLTTGNAGGTELLVDGEATPPLGPPGAVRRDIALEPDGLRAEIAKAGSTGRPPSQ
jgi:cytoskeleton protein RodZ